MFSRSLTHPSQPRRWWVSSSPVWVCSFSPAHPHSCSCPQTWAQTPLHTHCPLSPCWRPVLPQTPGASVACSEGWSGHDSSRHKLSWASRWSMHLPRCTKNPLSQRTVPLTLRFKPWEIFCPKWVFKLNSLPHLHLYWTAATPTMLEVRWSSAVPGTWPFVSSEQQYRVFGKCYRSNSCHYSIL